ncbi:hypothetical protein D3C78_1823400 [compost metagenome]
MRTMTISCDEEMLSIEVAQRVLSWRMNPGEYFADVSTYRLKSFLRCFLKGMIFNDVS